MKSRIGFLDKVLGKEPNQTPVVITSYSQPHVLQQRMHEEKLKHGDRVIANLSPVRIESNFGKSVMYFCPLQGIKIINRLEDGDGGNLPEEALVKELFIPKNLRPGLYNLKNVELYSNGTLQVNATADTEFESV